MDALLSAEPWPVQSDECIIIKASMPESCLSAKLLALLYNMRGLSSA